MATYLLLLILLASPTAAQPVAAQAPYPPAENSSSSSSFDWAATAIFAGLVFSLLFTGCIIIYIQWTFSNGAHGATPPHAAAAGSRHRRLSPTGLDPAVVNSFPMFNYSDVKHLRIGKGELSCAVCVSEFEDKERLRFLPRCDHAFHPECIDLWLASHSTCPLCRADLSRGTEWTQLPEACSRTDEMSRGVQNQNQIALVDENQRVDTERVIRVFPRPHSTGHSLVRLGEDHERYTLRLPEEVRRRQVDRGGTPDRWFFTTSRPFFTGTTGSVRSMKMGAVDFEVSTVGTSKVFLAGVRAPFDCLGGKSEKTSARLPV